jgi:hypothetical protein
MRVVKPNYRHFHKEGNTTDRTEDTFQRMGKQLASEYYQFFETSDGDCLRNGLTI